MSKPTFSFGVTGTGGSSNPLGQVSNSNQNGSSSSTTPASNPFTGATNTQQSSFFGVPTSQPASSATPFGSLNATAGAQKPLTFGSNTGSNPGSGTTTPSLFGASTGNPSGGSSLFGSNTGGSNAFGGDGGFNFSKKVDEGKDASTPMTSSFQTPNKTETTPQAQPGGLLGGASQASEPSTFGAATTSSSAPAGSTTPATTKPGGLFNFTNSTTPAGPPPTDNNTGTNAAGTNPFGSTQPSSGGLFGSQKPVDSAAKPATSQPAGFFSGTQAGGSSGSLFGSNTTAPRSGSGLFSGLNTAKPATSESNAPAASTSTTAAPTATFTFPSITTQPPTSSAPTTAKGPSLFGAASSNAPSSSTTGPGQATSLFGAAAPTTTSSSSTTPAQTSNFFGNLGKSSSTTTPAATSSSGTTTSAPASTLFPPKTTETTSSSIPATSTSAAPAGAGGVGASISAPLGASTAGPAPQLSRLKNKTMDEIITRWATDLSTYQKEFQNQAAKVASWDRLLVENGDKIQKLYTSTFEAERASAEVERQLASVESQQEELTAWLDHYEREVNDMFTKQVGQGESLQGPDQERERTYKLAEKLTDRLDEMGKDLTNMIQEINTASATLTKTSKPDDPLSQIVRVLNGHLSQLQWIDQNAAALQAKVAAAQKAGQSIAANGYGNAENDPADQFYRSYMGRR